MIRTGREGSALRRRMARLAEGLRDRFGVPRRRTRSNLLDALIRTVLSQSTTDHNRDMAFDRLKTAFPDWDAVADAGEAAIARAIRPAGLGNQKAGRIRSFLRWLRRERGEITLEFLHEEPDAAAVELLTRHKGIGVKTAYVTLMMASGRDLFPIDVHIHRICRRLGLIGEKITPERSHAELAPFVPAGRAHELHLNLLAFGRTVCTARNPRCGECDFTRMCRYYKERGGTGADPAQGPRAARRKGRSPSRRG